jgi:hypothetical protein
MAIIMQDGFDFIYKAPENYQRNVQRWSIERVAAYMSVIHAVQVKYTRYYSRITYCPRLGMIYYDLQNTDKATNRDLDKLTKYLSLYLLRELEKGSDVISAPLPEVLDKLEAHLKDYVKQSEEPFEVLGKKYYPPKFYSRPTREAYEAERIKAEAEANEHKAALAQALSTDKCIGKRIKISYGADVYVGRIVRITDKSIYVDVYDASHAVVQLNARLPKTSTRIVSGVF